MRLFGAGLVSPHERPAFGHLDRPRGSPSGERQPSLLHAEPLRHHAKPRTRGGGDRDRGGGGTEPQQQLFVEREYEATGGFGLDREGQRWSGQSQARDDVAVATLLGGLATKGYPSDLQRAVTAGRVKLAAESGQPILGCTSARL